MKKLVKVLSIIGLTLSLPSASFAYSNPVDIPESWTWNNGDYYGEGDPYILKHNGIYYLYVSTVDDKSGVKAWTSEDLVNWTYAGLVTEDTSTKAAYAPEVVYWNGSFYMYTSPAGNGHYVYKSSSPLGPFVKQTTNIGMGIDGHVFIDDDGKWYFYSTGSNRIDARQMPTPTTFGNATDTGAKMQGWTEGATLLKRNGKYYMTYTGNHVWNKAYRVNYAVSGSPTQGFTTDQSQNPILLNSEGENVGLGHNTVVRGPDLDSDYIVYHSHANPGRNMNLDRIAWNGDNMLVLGPTTSEQPDPDLPDFSDRFSRRDIGEKWINKNGGNWTISQDSSSHWLKQKNLGTSAWHMQISIDVSGKDYTAEFNMKAAELGNSENPRLGVVFSYTDEDNYGVVVLSPKNNRLETNFYIDGVEQGWEYSTLPANYDYAKLHQIRVEKSDASFEIFVDGMLKQTRKVSDIGGGSIGYTTQDVNGAFGYTAFSNKVDSSHVFDAYKPLPGKIEAVHYNSGGEGVAFHEISSEGSDKPYRQDDVDVARHSDGSYYVKSHEQGEWLKYNVNIAEDAPYNLDLRVGATSENTKLRILLDGTIDLTGAVSIPQSTDWRTFSLEKLQLPKGNHTITVEAVKGKFDFSSFKLQKYKEVDILFDDFKDGDAKGWNEIEGTWKVGPFEEIDFDEYKVIPGVINAAYYNTGGEGIAYHDNTTENIGGVLRRDAVDIRNNPQGGTVVGWNQTGEWLKYNVNVQETGEYNLLLNAATTFTSAKARLCLDDKTDLTGVFSVPSTGDWNNWKPVLKNGIKLPEGNHTIKLEFVEGEFDFANMEFVSVNTAQFNQYKQLPGKIMAADYINGGEGVAYHDLTKENIGGKYRLDAVDIRINPEGSYNVGWNQTGEWLKYNVEIPGAGTYDLQLKAATTFEGSQVRLWLDDTVDLTGVLDVPNTGGFDNWENVIKEDISLPAGQHTIKVETVKGEFDFSSFEFLDEATKPEIIGEYNASGDTFAKSVIGEKEWKDYIIEADVKVAEGNGDAGLIFRVNNPANGIELSQNNADFMQGYVAYLNKDGVHLGKQNYNWQYIKGAPITESVNTWNHMKVVVNGTNIKVFVGDMTTPKIDFTDNSSTAFTQGKVGVRSFYNNAKYDNFFVRPYKPSYKSVQQLLDMYKDSGELKESLYQSLSNKLKQSKHHLEKEEVDQAKKFLDDTIKLLTNANNEKLPIDKQEILKSDLGRFIEQL